jgi:ubiquinone/menaquinone biosynthesis C-methylase UbiE
MAWRVAYLFFFKKADCPGLVKKSYDNISSTYDATWTNHMRDITQELIDKLDCQPRQTAIDLTCGTGYATGLIAEKTLIPPTGVDSSSQMLVQARENYGESCNFIEADILEFLKGQPADSADIISCCWGLGYSRPWAVLRQIKRVLKPKGKVAIVDNSLSSLREILYCSFLTFAESPEKLTNLMRFRFLPGSKTLKTMLRLLNLKTSYSVNGEKVYHVKTGVEAVARLRQTGAAAGFEYAADDEHSDAIFERFAQVIEEKYEQHESIPIVHRYLAAIAEK